MVFNTNRSYCAGRATGWINQRIYVCVLTNTKPDPTPPAICRTNQEFACIKIMWQNMSKYQGIGLTVNWPLLTCAISPAGADWLFTDEDFVKSSVFISRPVLGSTIWMADLRGLFCLAGCEGTDGCWGNPFGWPLIGWVIGALLYE